MPPTVSPRDVARLVTHCRECLAAGLEAPTLGDEYYYRHLGLAVTDAVFSIGVTYTATRNTVHRQCAALGLAASAAPDVWPLHPDQQRPVSAFLTDATRLGGPSRLADRVFGNRQRTSSQYGVLKAEAVMLVLRALQDAGVETFQDFQSCLADPVRSAALESRIRSVPGQGSGVSWRYLCMLAGSEDEIKPDRMVLRFTETALGRPMPSGAAGLAAAQDLLVAAARILARTSPRLTPRRLDHLVWNYQRQQLAPVTAPPPRAGARSKVAGRRALRPR